MKLQPILARGTRPQVREIRLSACQHNAPAFLFYRCWKGAEPGFPLLAKCLSIQQECSVTKARCHDERVQHPFGTIAPPIQDGSDYGLKRGQRQMRHVVLLTGENDPLQMDIAIVHNIWRGVWP